VLTKEQIFKGLETNDKWVERALLVVFENQTSLEQSTERTRDNNGIGFTAYDAEFYTSLAKSLKKYGRLTPRQLTCLRKKNKWGVPAIGKYWRQIQEASAKKVAAATPLAKAS
jgi:hypothetical protein